MGIALSFIICSALVIELVIPAILRSYRLNEDKQRERYYMTKLRLVRKYYPELKDVTYSEIVAEYNVDALYDNLGRKQLKRLAPVTQSQLSGARESSKRSSSRRVAA